MVSAVVVVVSVCVCVGVGACMGVCMRVSVCLFASNRYIAYNIMAVFYDCWPPVTLCRRKEWMVSAVVVCVSV